MTTLTEADTCRKYVLPKLYAAEWTDEQISEQKSFTDGRIVVAGEKPTRRKQKRADYLLKYRRDFTLAVVEAKSVYKKPGDGLQQAKDYAQILGLKFAYSTNGQGIVEHDFFTGKDNDLETFPTPDELWHRLQTGENITPEISERVLAPYYHLPGNFLCDQHPRDSIKIGVGIGIGIGCSRTSCCNWSGVSPDNGRFPVRPFSLIRSAAW